MEVILANEAHDDPFLFEGLNAWEEHRERLFSKEIPHQAWCELAAIFRALLELASIIKSTRGDEWTKEAQSALERGVSLCNRGIELLNPLIAKSTGRPNRGDSSTDLAT